MAAAAAFVEELGAVLDALVARVLAAQLDLLLAAGGGTQRDGDGDGERGDLPRARHEAAHIIRRSMRSLLTCLLAATVCLSIAACGGDDKKGGGGKAATFAKTDTVAITGRE